MQTVIPQNREILVSQNVPHSKFLRSLVTAKISDNKVVLLYFPDILNRSVDVRSLIAPIKGKYSKQFGLEGGGGGGGRDTFLACKSFLSAGSIVQFFFTILPLLAFVE